LNRARRELEIDEERANLVRLLESRQTSPAGRAIRRFTVRDRDRYLLIKDDEIDWVESAANYVKLHARGRAFMLRMTMTEMERTLDAARFARIHRSTIVNIDRIKEITPEWHGDFDVVLQSGQTLRLSRSYRDRLLP
jgi:two-component system LytT family response regulator